MGGKVRTCPDIDADADVDGGGLWLAVRTVSLSHFCMGYNVGIVNGAIFSMGQDPLFGGIGLARHGVIVSCILVGAVVGAMCSSLSERVGRRPMLLGVAATFAVGPALMALAGGFQFLVAARTLTGVGAGVTSNLTNMYVGEIAPADRRGRLGGWAPFLGTSGVLASYLVSALLHCALPQRSGAFVSWRWQLGLAVVPAACILLFRDHFPETPHWLLVQGDREAARRSMQVLFPGAPASFIVEELDRAEADVRQSAETCSPASSKNCYGSCWSWCKAVWRLRVLCFVGLAVNVLQQVCGINVVICYGASILSELGFSPGASIALNALVGVVQLRAAYVVIKYVDLVGRRMFALCGTLLMAGGLGLLSCAFLLKSAAGPPAVALGLTLAGTLVFRVAFSMSLGPLPYIMTSELFPPEARAAGGALCWAANFGSNFCVSLAFPLAMDHFKGPGGTAFIFASFVACCIGAFAFVYVMLPETAGRRLGDVRTEPLLSDCDASAAASSGP